jgi:transposase
VERRGPDGLADRRAAANGGKPKLTPQQQAELFAALQQPPPDAGLWTGSTVAAFVRGPWGGTVCKQTGWEGLRQWGFSLQVPRPKNPGAAAAAEQRAWKRRHGSVESRAAPAAPRQAGRAVGRG